MQDRESHGLRVRRGREERILNPAAFQSVPRFLLLIPVYRELDNGNLVRFFGSVAAAGASDGEVDLFFLVNNSEAAAAARDEAFLENQRTLVFLSEQAKAPGPRVHTLDLSSAGFEKNMGKLRQAGLEAWPERVPSAELARTVVVHLDADVRLPAKFFARLSSVYGAYPGLGAAFFQRDYDLRGVPSAELLFTHHRYRLRKALFDFTNVRTFLSEGLATYQLSARFLAHEEAGGFPPVPKDEDSLFTRALCEKTWWAHLPDLELVTEDRTRAEGFNSARRARDLRGGSRAASWRREVTALWQWLTGSPFAAVEALRPPPPKDFFLQFGLFEPKARLLNEEVRGGAKTFGAAAAELHSLIELTLGAPVLSAPTAFAKASREDLPAEAFVPGTGGSVLPPVAHPVAACLLMPTLSPGTDLRGIFAPHCSGTEQDAFAGFAEAELQKISAAAAQRRQALTTFFGGAACPAGNDPFLAWVNSAPALFSPIQKKVMSGRLSASRAVEEFTRVFPDYLSDGPSFAREAALVRALTRVLAGAHSASGDSGLEKATARLR